ncbi:MFS transporter [Alkalibacter mobilis]|uniref:MFS transporter n=1 Tax=Alkalibacter mobilis TaxID=2787712 RepID=UPI00189EFB52|nr:MFS transporter [Alkalibacter mobilis]MBF7097431.1 MFS transporter [Alkalibacter mobilis]
MISDWKKKTALFLLSQNISLFGSMLVQYAIMWYITLETKSGVMMTMAIICGMMPTFLISPFAGVWADRYNRKTLIVIADFFIAAITLILALVFYLGHGSMWLLFVGLGLRSLGTGVQTPAVTALLPQIVPFEYLTKVNGMNGSLQSMVSLLAPMASGALLTFTRIESIFMIDVITASIAILILVVFLDVPSHHKAMIKEKINYFIDMSKGLSYIKHHSYIKTIFIYCAVYYLLVSPLAFLTPLQVTRSFGEDVWRLTAIEVTFSVGMMLGGFLIATWGGFENKVKTMTLAIFIIAFSTMGLGSVHSFTIYLGFMITVGIAMPVFYTPFTVLLQQKVESDFQGRVFGVFSMISTSVMPLSMLFFGPVADFLKIETLLLVTGAIMLIQGIIMSKDKVLIEAGK